MVQKNFEDFFKKVDTNNDGKIDRWELYEYCIKNIAPDSDWSINTINNLALHLLVNISLNKLITTTLNDFH